MTVKHVCEHCGTEVPLARVCPNCRNEHSAEWLAKNERVEAATGLAMLFAGGYMIYQIIQIWNLPINVFFPAMGMILLKGLGIGVLVVVLHAWAHAKLDVKAETQVRREPTL